MTVTPSPEALQAAEVYAATFAGRLDAYSIYIPGDADHDGRWDAIRRPLTGEIVIRAFQTSVPISGYFLDRDSMTHLAALDLDLEGGYKLGAVFLAKLRELGGVGYLERSRRGAHVWIVIDDVRPGIILRMGLRAIGIEAGLPTDPGDPAKRRSPDPTRLHPKIELRPGSDHLGRAKEGEPAPLGHCLRMPTMPHQTTGIRYALQSSDGEGLSEKLTGFIPQIELCKATIFDEAAERAPQPKFSAPADLARPWSTKTDDEEGSASDILLNLWGAQGRLIPGRATICPAHADTRPTLLIFRDDQRVLCYSPECELNNDGHGRGTKELTRMAPRKR